MRANKLDIDIGQLMQMFATSSTAASEVLRDQACDPDTLDSLMAQAALYKDLWVRAWGGTDLDRNIRSALARALLEIENRSVVRDIVALADLTVPLIRKNLHESYNSGSVRNPMFGPVDGNYFHVVTMPASTESAKHYFDTKFGGYGAYLADTARNLAGDSSDESLLEGSTLCQLIVTSALPFQSTIRIGLWDLGRAQPILVPPELAPQTLDPSPPASWWRRLMGR